MARSDYLVGISKDDGGFKFLGGDEGLRIRHDSLTNPLTLQGDHCRLWMASGTNTQDKKFQWTFDFAQQPNFSRITQDKAVQMTMWIRRTGGANYALGGVGLKTREIVGNQKPRGCLLMLGEANNFETTGPNNVQFRTVDGDGNNRFQANELAVITEDTWVQLRMDVLPIRQGSVFIGDEFRIYRNTNEASPSWELLLTKRLYRFIDRGFIPWWDDDPPYDTTQFESAGFHIWMIGDSSAERANNDNLNTGRIYTSSFEMKVETAFP